MHSQKKIGTWVSLREDLKASNAIGARNYDVAIDIYKKRIASNESTPEDICLLAFCYAWKDDIESALYYANKRLAQNPTDFHVLLLTARCWFKKNDADQTYNYACRALENVPYFEPNDPCKKFYFILKLLSIFKRFRGIYFKAKEGHLRFKKQHKEDIDWAWKYKVGYEEKKRLELTEY